MTKAISYSLFGFERVTPDNCFAFETYVRGFFVNCRINRVLYPEFVTVLNIDELSFASPYNKIFTWLEENLKVLIVRKANNVPLCRAMLWRLETSFTFEHPNWVYSHVLCRDTDSISTYREAQAVSQWIAEDRAVHCITDSISHNIPMMGGMIGIRPGYINDRNASGSPGGKRHALFDSRCTYPGGYGSQVFRHMRWSYRGERLLRTSYVEMA